MKKLILAALAIIMVVSAVSAAENQKTSTQKQFQKEFTGTTNEKWSSDENFDYVSFEKNGRLYSAVYSKDDGEMVGVATLTEVTQIPVSVTGLLQKKFEGYKVTGKSIEVTYNDRVDYVVSVETEKQLLTVRVSANRVTVTNRLQKM
jgi:opacity protein-like surface antigen